MSDKSTALIPQKAPRNNAKAGSTAIIQIPQGIPDKVAWWAEQYFSFEVTTSSSSQKVQRRDIEAFIRYMLHRRRDGQACGVVATSVKGI
jgi:hypothetical protein